MASWFGKPGVDVYEDIYVKYTPINTATVIVNSSLDHIGLYSVNDGCYKCPYKLEVAFESYHKTVHCNVDTKELHTFRVLKENRKELLEPDYRSGLLCEVRPTLGGYGVYKLNVGTCEFETLVEPPNPYLPLLLFTAILLASITTFGLIRSFLRKRNNEAKYNEGSNLTARRDNLDIMPSLHFLRGILLILIIFATTGGGGYPIFFRDFGGLTVAECFFFAYTLTVGLKIPVMFDEETKKAWTRRTVFGTIFMRSIFLCFLGLVISGTAPRSGFIINPLFAPLPRIAIAYLVAATVYMFVRKRNPNDKIIVAKAFTNVKSLLWSWVLAGVLVIIMIISIAVFYTTECKPKPLDETVDLWLDRNGLQCEYDVFSEVFNKNLLSENRDEPFFIDSYNTFTQGALGFVSSILTALVGLKVGLIYVEETTDRLNLWHLWASLLCFAGITLAIMSKVLSFNLWPIATVFVVSSLSIDFYTLIYYLTEIRNFSSKIISYCGIASTATLAGHLLFSHSFPFFWREVLDTHFFYLCQSSWVVLLWVIITVYFTKWRSSLLNRVITDEGTKRALLSW